jgi:excisionase family DNA binding protein
MVATNPASMERGMIAQTTPPAEPIQLLRLREVARRLDVSISTLRREIRSRRLKAVRIGRVVRISEAELAGYIAARPRR